MLQATQTLTDDLQARPKAQSRSFLTVEQFSQKHPAFSQSSLRSLIFHSRARHSSKNGKLPANGLAVAIRRIGRKVLLDETAFFEWLDRQSPEE
jgi:hypothetical protein